MSVKYKAHNYQDVATQHIIDHDRCGLFLDMGLGKTATTLEAIRVLKYEMFEINRVLIIAPPEVVENTWEQEGSKWLEFRDLSFNRLSGAKKHREKLLEREADVYLVSNALVSWIIDYYEGKPWPFDMVVVDELSGFKNSSSVRFKKLKKVVKNTKRFVGLTGTPTPNGLLNLWAQIYLIDGGKRLGKTFTAYKDRFFYPGARNGHIIYNWILRKGAEEEIHDLVKDICISMECKDYLKMPEREDRYYTVELDDDEREMYNTLESDMFLSFTEESEVEALSKGVLMNKLLQLANGAVYDSERNVKIVHDRKLEALEDIVAEGDDIVVFYAFKHDRDRIIERFKDRVTIITKDTVDFVGLWNTVDNLCTPVDNFGISVDNLCTPVDNLAKPVDNLAKPVDNLCTPVDNLAKPVDNSGVVHGDLGAKKSRMMLLHPKSASTGLNLQHGGRRLTWYGLTFSLEDYLQATARIYRQGQQRDVIVDHIVTKDTKDEYALEVLARKKTPQDALKSALKSLANTYTKNQ